MACASVKDDTHLEFDQAMVDFGRMFPELESNVIEKVLRANAGAVDDTIDHLLVLTMEDHGASSKVHDTTLPKVIDDNVDFPNQIYLRLPNPQSQTQNQPQSRRIYEPPLIGDLPDDFLRIASFSVDESRCLDSIYDEIDVKRKRNREKWETNRKTTLGVISNSSTQAKSPKRDRRERVDMERESDRLKDLMIENEYRRQLATDPQLEQYLMDEKVAIMLQNKEFMRSIRKNRDFIATLEREEPPRIRPQLRQYPIPQTLRRKSTDKTKSGTWNLKSLKRQLSGKTLMYGDEVPIPDGPIADHSANSSIDDNATYRTEGESGFVDYQNSYQGYGKEGGSGSMEPFPFTKKIEGEGEESQKQLQLRVKHMNKASKQRFALLASRFVQKSKGAPGILGKESCEMSRVGLLDSSEDLSVSDFAYSSGGYIQQQDHMYNIGKRADLKEGRLFSK